MRESPYEVYSSFDVGETLSWTASHSGTALANSTATVALVFPNYDYILVVGTDDDPNFSKSGTYTITSSAPPFDAFNVEVDVDNQLPGTSSAVTIQVVCYDSSAPTITSLSPRGGSVSGGTSVTVEGTAFVGVSEVSFGGVPASSYTVVSPTRIVAIAPANVSGAADVNVSNGNGAASQNQSFIYAELPVISPAAGALTAGIVGVNYNAATFSASDGVAPYSFAVADGDTLPAGLSLSVTGEITGIPTTAGSYNFTVVVKDDIAQTNAAAYTMEIAELPIVGAVSAPVAANSADNVITLSLSGGAATSVAVSTQATKGVATASGTAITYTPNPGYSGVDSFSYTATNDAGTSASATVTITVSAPTFAISPASGALTSGTQNVSYSSGAIAVSNGMAPYTFVLASGDALPAGLALDAATGEISGTPTSMGSASFTIDITDVNTVCPAP
ncbi:putative Ig domain-containing protein [Agrobacterium bohemicum]|uniref:IPT/TIG domain-containing protein n=1 Tax=Agrobacterium bohemicum TaxID=2052828 RepID=A0A135P4I4_9HYPH|nr:putative Ig domain-containing protein [Agrobacterium bohemicum]KXG86320.1 hypothetical protein ATO67_22050 [Agrobacterium bohemicum]